MTVRKVLFLAGALMLLLGTVPDVLATAYYVSSSTGNDGWEGTAPAPVPSDNPENGPWKTLWHVNDQPFKPGDSISFKRGDTWAGEQLIINWSGAIGNQITFTAYGEGAKPVFNLSGADFHGIFIKEKDAILIENITIRNYGTHAPSFGIYIYYSNHIVIKNCTIRGENVFAEKGIYIESASDAITVDSNDISRCRAGIYIAGSVRYHPSNVIIRNNIIHDMNKGASFVTYGIQFYPGREVLPIDYTGTIIEDNNIYNCATAIAHTHAKNLTIKDNFADPERVIDSESAAHARTATGEVEENRISSNRRFKDNKDGTVTDDDTGLMWTKNANPYQEAMLIYEAIRCIEEMNRGMYPNYGKNDWRLPMRDELTSLIDYAHYTQYGHTLPPGHPFDKVQVAGLSFWSSPAYLTAAYPWFSSLYCRLVGHNVKTCYGYVWPVRSRRDGTE